MQFKNYQRTKHLKSTGQTYQGVMISGKKKQFGTQVKNNSDKSLKPNSLVLLQRSFLVQNCVHWHFLIRLGLKMMVIYLFMKTQNQEEYTLQW